MPNKPTSAVLLVSLEVSLRLGQTYMNPAPPVIMIFLTSGKGSNLVEPISIGASFHTP